MIRLNKVSKTYQTDKVETLALKDIDLHEKSEFVSIMGPSGCGKSTLLNLIGLLDEPGAGSIHVAARRWPRTRTSTWPGCATTPLASSSRAST
jgi:ABC-type lipoprotein export system ATPase subunit